MSNIIKRCPCRIWKNCLQFDNRKNSELSNSNTGLSNSNTELSKIINDWYRTIFRLNYQTPDIFPNG